MPITLKDIENFRVIQRVGNSKDVFISGTYTGTAPASVEAQIIDTSGAVVVPWTTLSDPVFNGYWGGTINVPEGGWYKTQVRDPANSGVVITGSNKWGVGDVILGIGQSLMQYMSVAGQSPTPPVNPLTSRKLNEGGWMAPQFNGEIVLLDEIQKVVGVPVGFLNMAVGSTYLNPNIMTTSVCWLSEEVGGIFEKMLNGLFQAGNDCAAILFDLGQNDASIGTPRDFFIQGTRQLKDKIDAFMGKAVPMLIGVLGRDQQAGVPTTNATWQAIREAQIALTKRFPDMKPGMYAGDLPVSTGGVHFTVDGFVRAARRWAQSFLHWTGHAPHHGAWVEADYAMSYANTVAEVGVKLDGATALSSPTPTGFTVSTNNFLTAISFNGTDVTTDRARLLLGNPIPSPLLHKVRYQYGRDYPVASPVYDNLPPCGDSVGRPLLTISELRMGWPA